MYVFPSQLLTEGFNSKQRKLHEWSLHLSTIARHSHRYIHTHFVCLKEYFQGQSLSIAFSQWCTQFASLWAHSSSADYLTLPEDEDFHSAGSIMQLLEEPPTIPEQPHVQCQEAVSTRFVSQEKTISPKRNPPASIFFMHIQGESIFLMMLENKPYTSSPIEIGRL